MCRAPSPNRRRSLSASIAASTRSRLRSGSPMPMNTMLVRRRLGRETARGEADLVHDLGDLEVASEAKLTGRAERAADRTTGLARDAQRVPLARSRPRRIVHQDRLDEGPSASRWRAFSVRPPSASRSSVSATVSKTNAASSAARSGPAASGARRCGRRRATRRPRSGARGTRALHVRRARPRSASGVRPDRPGRRWSRGHESDASARADDPGTGAQERLPGHALAARRLDLEEPEAGRRRRARPALVGRRPLRSRAMDPGSPTRRRSGRTSCR